MGWKSLGWWEQIGGVVAGDFSIAGFAVKDDLRI